MRNLLMSFLVLLLGACTSALPPIPVDSRSVEPGSEVMRGSDRLKLLGTPLQVGQPLPEVTLFNTALQPVNLRELQGEVLLISVVPSLDTQVCERQTHILAEEGADLPAGIRRITISRDLPFAQKRFAEAEPALGEVFYLSDYAQADFGQATGLLIDRIRLLARAVIVTDRQGTVRYLQVVPTITHLPDLHRGMEVARQLAGS